MLLAGEQYFCTVTEMEARLRITRQRLGADELREESERLDKNCGIAHDALISDLHIFNRYIVRQFGDDLPASGIFNRSPEAIHDRLAVADWTGELFAALFANRRR